jgi:hypothetical protein
MKKLDLEQKGHKNHRQEDQVALCNQKESHNLRDKLRVWSKYQEAVQEWCHQPVHQDRRSLDYLTKPRRLRNHLDQFQAKLQNRNRLSHNIQWTLLSSQPSILYRCQVRSRKPH